MLLLQLSTLGLLAAVSALPTYKYVVHEERSEPSKQLLKRGSSLHSEAILPVRLWRVLIMQWSREAALHD